MRRPLPSVVAAGSLVVGFGVAAATGVRPLGGIVLFAAALWFGLQWKARPGLPTAIGLVLLYLALFAASHPLGHQIGSWPAVFTVAAVMGLAGWLIGDRPAARYIAAR